MQSTGQTGIQSPAPSQILETIDWSAQLDQRDKEFSRFFLDSDYLHAA